MTSGKMVSGSYRLLRHAPLLLLPMAMLAAVGCVPLSKNRARVSVQRYPSGAEKSPVAAARGNASSLAPIINEKIQRGYYAEGERALRQYLVEHPGDGAAQAMLHQLTVDPTQMLGSDARDYTVKSGDSYSSLAARYLGDASLFVVLARYNGSRNPSDLRLGQTLRMPLSKPGAGAVVSDTSPTSETAAPQTEVITDASPSEKARLLQDESVVLFKEGRKQDALERLDHALLIQPNLKSNGAIASSLRKQLVANYHEQAVVLYRDQKLDSAIALWDRVLAIDPGFEPAVIYRTRALELKQRLKQF
jgi:tetratricopeptide (TPR) repeat protein